MQMTFDEYINNPMGKENAVISNREMFRNLYTEKLEKILVRESGKVKYNLYKSKNNYYIHLKIPSEVINKFYYDTVIEFRPKDNSSQYEKNLKNYNVKFYSNDPSFVFTFAHAMLENDLFVRDLVPRMSKEAVKRVAKEKNPKNTVGYVKSLYFSYLLMKRYSLFDKISFDSYSTRYDKVKLLLEIEHADKKVKDRQEAQEKLTKTKSVQRKKEQNKMVRSDSVVSNIINTGIDKIKNTGRINNVLKSNTSKISRVVKKKK